MEWVIIIAAITCIAAFFLGRKFASKPIENNNYLIEQQRIELEKELQNYKLNIEKEKNKLDANIQVFENANKQLLSENQSLQSSIRSNKQLNEQIQQEYEDKLQVIKDTEQLAEKAHADKVAKLENEYEAYKKVIDNEKTILSEVIEKVNAELNSLKATQAAAIEAARNEQNIRDNKEQYCLILPREEQGDISLLLDVRQKVSKPRAISMAIWSAYFQPLAKKQFPKILTKQDVCGVYKITNLKTGECYIGQSQDIRKRWYDHAKASLGVDTPSGNLLYQAVQEYGLENFSFELLEECDAKDLDKKEKYFIELYQSNIVGYNGTGGNNG